MKAAAGIKRAPRARAISRKSPASLLHKVPRKNVSELSSRPTHLDEKGRLRMVNVSAKPVTLRRAVAEARVRMSSRALRAIRSGNLPKGDIGAAVRIAAIHAAKKTSDFIPLCHPLSLDHVEVRTRTTKSEMIIETEAVTTARTGVEMEAMTAAAVGALVVYDMVKSMERGVTIGPVRLLEKEGGRSGRWTRLRTS